jgi:hypothetical protein
VRKTVNRLGANTLFTDGGEERVVEARIPQASAPTVTLERHAIIALANS